MFIGLLSLYILELYNNHVEILEAFSYNGLLNMQHLDLSEQHITMMQPFAFHGLCNLKELNLSQNVIAYIGKYIFDDLKSIEIIDITSNAIQYIQTDAVTALTSLLHIYSSVDRLCCMIPQFISCTPTLPRLPHLVCDRLIPGTILVVLIWLAASSILLLDIVIFIKAIVKSSGNDNQILDCIYRCTGDGCTGFYMLILAAMNQHYGEHFPLQVHVWEESIWCKVANLILSTSMSIYSISLSETAVEYFLIVYVPFRSNVIIPLFQKLQIIPIVLFLGLTFAQMWLKTGQEICVYFEANATSSSTFLMITRLFLDLFLTMLATIRTFCSIHIANKVRKSAGRAWTEKEMKMIAHFLILNVCNIMRWLVSVSDIFLMLVGYTLSKRRLLWVVSSVLPCTVICKAILQK